MLPTTSCGLPLQHCAVDEVSLEAQKSPSEYRDVMGSMLEVVDRLTKLVESLQTSSAATSQLSQTTSFPWGTRPQSLAYCLTAQNSILVVGRRVVNIIESRHEVDLSAAELGLEGGEVLPG